MSMWIGIEGKARSVKSIYIGINGTARKVKAAYLGVNNIARPIYTSIYQYIKDIPTTLGQTCNWAGYNWKVVHVTDDLIYMMLTDVHSKIAGTNDTSSKYAGSASAKACDDFLNTIPSEYQAILQDIEVNGVTNKVFVPALGMLCSDHRYDLSEYTKFDYFPDSINYCEERSAYYNGNYCQWWTSTTYGNTKRWYITGNGHSGYYGNYGASYGFRPFIAVKRK